MQQEFQYVGVGKQGYASIPMNQEEAFISTYVYKKVATCQQVQQVSNDQKFTDKQFQQSTEWKEIDNRDYSFVELDKITNGNLFKQLGYSSVDSKFQQSINCLKQLRLFPIDYYKTLFTTSTISSQGIYKIILNVNGVYRYVCVDDRVPVCVKSGMKHSIFGLKFSHPWQILLLKAYAKMLGGYRFLKSAEPFSFIKAVTFNNWRLKLFDSMDKQTHLQFLQNKLHGDITPNYLQESNANVGIMTVASKVEQSVTFQSLKNESRPIQFLSSQNHFNKQNMHQSRYISPPTEALICSTQHSFTIIPKTKNNPKIKQYGLLENSSCYRITNVFQMETDSILKVQSSTKSRWNGKYSIFDPVLQKYYSQKNHRLTLERNFMMSLEDCRQLFSATLISPIDYQLPISSISTCEVINLPENNKQAQYFEFEVSHPGKYDISIIQPQSNMMDINQDIHSFSTIKTSRKAYPSVKILMGRRNQVQGQISTEAETLWNCVDASFSKSPGNIITYFENLIPGRYMLRIKIQNSWKPLSYNLNIVSDSPVKLYWVDPPKLERSLFQRSCMLTLAQQKADMFYLDSQTCQEWVSYGNAYLDIGYAFVAFGAEQRSPYRLYCEIDTELLQKQGFKLKFPYKNKGKQIGMFVEPGFSKVIILKREAEPDVWPPASIRFFKVQT